MAATRRNLAADGTAAGWAVLAALALVTAIACGGGPPDPFAAPDTAYTTVIDGLKDNRPEVLWQALPASYQQDITALIHEFAATVDSDVYDRSFTVLAKAGTVLGTKKDLILESGMLDRAGVPGERASAGVDAAAQLLQTLAGSEVGRIETLKTLDLSTSLGTTGSQLMTLAAEISAMVPSDPYQSQFAHHLENTTVEMVSSKGDRAVIRVQLPYKLPEEMNLVRVDDRWVPAELADRWPFLVESARAKMTELNTEQFAANKPKIIMVLGMVEAALDQVAAAETQEELVAAQQAILGMVMAAAAMG